MNQHKYITTRVITRDECNWLDAEITAGTIIYKCLLPTYGCVDEFPATFNPDGGYPFFELPWNSIQELQ